MSLLAPLLLRPHTFESALIALRSTGRCISHIPPSQGKRKQHIPRGFSRDDTRRKLPEEKTFEDICIGGLVEAGRCREHRRAESGSHGRRQRHNLQQTRSIHTASTRKHKAVRKPEISRDQYRKLADFYPDFEPAKAVHLCEEQRAKKQRHIPLAPRLFLTAEQEHLPQRLRRVLPPEDDYHARQIADLNKLIETKPGYLNLDTLWQLYQDLRPPRPRYLQNRTLWTMLRHLGWVERWYTPNAMQRYFQLLNDCVAENVSLNKKNWTTAIAFAGRWARNISTDQVRRAVETWMQMEQQGHSADHVTFNVLFDLAIKAGRFALADTIYNEMTARDMPLDRYFRASLIYYAGMKRDGDGVRKAFRDFVQAGEIVDTVIMNAVILSLLRAGEAPAAEHVFERMQSLHEEKFGTQSLTAWQESKEMTALLNKTANELRKKKKEHQSTFFGAPFSIDEKRDEVQKAAPIAPDAETHIILIKYHAYTSGDADRTWDLLYGMRQHNLRLTGATYVFLFRGFNLHGGYAFSAWNYERLQELWRQTVEVCTHAQLSISDSNPEAVALHTIDAGGYAQYNEVTESTYVEKHQYEISSRYAESEGSDDRDILGPMMSSESKKGGLMTDTASTSMSGADPQLSELPATDAPPIDATEAQDPARYEPIQTEKLRRVVIEPTSPKGLSAKAAFHATPESRPHTTVPSNDSSSIVQKVALPANTTPAISMTTPLAIAVIRAFYQCTGRRRTLEVWDEMRRTWMHREENIDWGKVQTEVEKCQTHAAQYAYQDYDRMR